MRDWAHYRYELLKIWWWIKPRAKMLLDGPGRVTDRMVANAGLTSEACRIYRPEHKAF